MQITPVTDSEIFGKLAERREWSCGYDLANQSSIRFVENEEDLTNFVSGLRPEQRTEKVLSEKKVPSYLKKMQIIVKLLLPTPNVAMRSGLLMVNEPAMERNGYQGGWHVFTFICIKYSEEVVVIELMMQQVSYFAH